VEPRRRPDPDFDPESARPGRLADHDPAEHQRVLVNPFLATLALIAWWAATLALIRGPFPPSALLPILALAGLPWLIQFHCLDCGRTGAYPTLRRHACPAILARRLEDRPSRAILPRPRSQLVVWWYLIGSVTLILAVAGPPGR